MIVKQSLWAKSATSLALLFLIACESKQLSVYDQSINPYRQHGIGVEGHMGVAMSSCLATPPTIQPIRESKGGPLRSEDSYFECVEREVIKKELVDIKNTKKKDELILNQPSDR